MRFSSNLTTLYRTSADEGGGGVISDAIEKRSKEHLKATVERHVSPKIFSDYFSAFLVFCIGLRIFHFSCYLLFVLVYYDELSRNNYILSKDRKKESISGKFSDC